jgi:hypothetical protein
VNPSVKGLLAAVLLALSFGAAVARPAAAASPCWKVLLTDWYDGRIDHTYPIACYVSALRHLPSDVQEYSSAHDDIQHALFDARIRDRRAGRPDTPATLVPAAPAPTTTDDSSGGGAPPPSAPAPAPTEPAAPPVSTFPATTTPLPGNRRNTGLARLVDRIDPASPTSLPVPLLVLGGLAVLLVAAGGVGVLVRRSQDRS